MSVQPHLLTEPDPLGELLQEAELAEAERRGREVLEQAERREQDEATMIAECVP